MTSVGVFYLGTFADADTDESNWSNEDDEIFKGTHDKSKIKVLNVDVTEPKDDGIAYDNDRGQTASQITYDIGGGQVTSAQDSTATYEVVITLGDGSHISTVVNIIQLDNGVTFLNENINGVSLDNLAVKSFSIGDLVGDNASGWYTARSAENARAVCFAAGTMIATPSGERAVEGLKVGDLVLTEDRGTQPIMWVSHRPVMALGAHAPVVFDVDALGAGLPHRRLLVSQQHRMLVRSPIAERIFGTAEVFVPAKHLAEVPGCRNLGFVQIINYHHIMLDHHAVVRANGVPSETFLVGKEALLMLTPADRARLEVLSRNFALPRTPCRPVATGNQRRNLIARHLKNAKPLVATGGTFDATRIAPPDSHSSQQLPRLVQT